MRSLALTITLLAACGPMTPEDFDDWTLSSIPDSDAFPDSFSGSSSPTEDTDFVPSCEVSAVYVAPDSVDERPWIRVLHDGCSLEALMIEAQRWTLRSVSTNNESNGALVPFGFEDTYPDVLTNTCAIFMWGLDSKAPMWALKRDGSVIDDFNSAAGWMPGAHQAAERMDQGHPWIVENVADDPRCPDEIDSGTSDETGGSETSEV